MDKRGWSECECVWCMYVCVSVSVCVRGVGEGDNFDIRKTLNGRIYTSFYVVPKRTIAYDAL